MTAYYTVTDFCGGYLDGLDGRAFDGAKPATETAPEVQAAKPAPGKGETVPEKASAAEPGKDTAPAKEAGPAPEETAPADVQAVRAWAESSRAFFASCGIRARCTDVAKAPAFWALTYRPEPGAAYPTRALKRAADLLHNALGYSLETAPGGFVVRIPHPRNYYCYDVAAPCILSRLKETGDPHAVILSPGVDDFCRPVLTSLDDMRHLLIAGSTGSGKSCLLNALICEMLSFSDAYIVLIDPKGGAEFGMYKGIEEHSGGEVITDYPGALKALRRTKAAMNMRYKEMSERGLRKYDDLHIVVVIDEFADLLMNAGKEVESLVVELAQKGRAANVNVILATQDPRAQIVTGLIKYNLPTKICLKTANGRHSMNVMDTTEGADLLGNGDALLKLPDSPDLRRLQAFMATDEQITWLMRHWD